MWKALTNCIPTRENLRKIRVIKDSLCPICKGEEETTCHVLWKCLTTSYVWVESGRPVQKWSSTTEDLKEVWETMTQRLNQGELELLA